MNSSPSPNPTIIRNSRGLSIAGTRITLYTLMDYLKADWPPHLIRDWFDLTDQQIEEALAYIEAHREEVEADYKKVVKEADESKKYWEEKNRERFAKTATLPPPPGKEAAWAKLQEKKQHLAHV